MIKLFQKFSPRQGPAAQRLNATPHAWGRRRQRKKMIIIIGAGISGLTIANTLDREYLILEKENYCGGLSTQYLSEGGYRFDFGGHYFHFQDKAEIKTYLDEFAVFKEFKRQSRVFALDRYIPFPLQYHLYYLPAPLRKTLLQGILQRREIRTGNLEEYLLDSFGEALFDFFFKPFLGKYYNISLRDLAANMDKGSIPVPDKESAAAGAAGKKFVSAGYNPVFYYPRNSLRGFMESYAAGFSQNASGRLRGRVHRTPGGKIKLNEEVIEIDLDKKKLRTKNSTYDYEYIINTMPLKNLLKIIEQPDRFPPYQNLQNISTLVSNVVLKKRRKRLHWVYLPEEQFPFYRAGFYPLHVQNVPVSYLEKTVDARKPIDKDALFEEILFTLKKLKFIENKEEIVYFDPRSIPVSYVLFDKQWRDTVPAALKTLEENGVYSTGRFATWNYSSMSDDVKAAINLAKSFASGGPAGGQTFEKV